MQKECLIPENVSVEVDGKKVKVSGEKGSLEREFSFLWDIRIQKDGNKIIVSADSDKRKVKAMIGTIIGHIKNMIKGVTKGYRYRMKIVYSHYPMTVKVEGNKFSITNFLGEKTPRVTYIKGNTKVEVVGQDIIISGQNKEDVGQTMGNIEQLCRVTKFDRRIFQDGIYFVGENDG